MEISASAACHSAMNLSVTHSGANIEGNREPWTSCAAVTDDDSTEVAVPTASASPQTGFKYGYAT